MQTQYQSVETAAGWKIVVDPSVNPIPPTSYTIQRTPNGLVSYCTAPAFGGACASLTLPLGTMASLATFDFSFTPDAAASQVAQAYEFDIIVSIGKLWYNGSFQINVAEGYQPQIPDANGHWADVGGTVVIKPYGQPNYVRTILGVNQATKQFQFLGGFVNGQDIPAGPVLPAKQMNWADGVTLQVQLVTAKAGTFSHITDSMVVTLS